MKSDLRFDGILLLSGLVCFGCSSSSKNNASGTAGTGVVGNPTAAGTLSTGTGGTTAAAGSPGATGTAGTKATGGTAGTSAASGGNGAAGQGAAAGTGSAGMGGPAAGAGGSTVTPPSGGASVLQYHKNPSHDGLYVDAAFTKAAAAKLHRDKSFNATVDGAIYAQPLYFEGGPGGKDLVIVATENNEVTALDAASGSVVWQRKSDVLSMPAGSTISTGGCGNIHPLGITGTPVIDAASRTLYFDAMDSNGTHKIYALGVDDGMAPSGWPVDVSSISAGGTNFNSPPQNQRGGLTILNGTLFVPYGGHYGDCGDYHGWVVGVPLNNPKAPIAWVTRAFAGGVWAPGGISTDGTSIYFATGNNEGSAGGLFSSPAMWGDGEAIFKMPPTLKASGQATDFWAAPNWSSLDMGDSDIGGSSPVLFSVPGATPSDLLVTLGKDGMVYLIGRANMGGQAAPLASLTVGGQLINGTAAYATGSGSYVVFKTYFGALTAVHISAASPPAMMKAWSVSSVTGQGSPMVTTSDGKADAIVWYVDAGGDNKLYGYDGDMGTPVFTGGGADEQLPVVDKFSTPIAAKGRIFVAAENTVYAFSVN